jgi:hypothetical protein
MRVMRSVIGCLGGLALVALAAVPARAGDVNCANPTSCGFGSATVFGASGALTSLAGDKATFSETVYFNSSTGIYTYEFTVANVGGNTLSSANTLTLEPGPSSVDHFNPGDSYGVVTGSTSSTFGTAAFQFNPLSLTVCFESNSSGCLESLKVGQDFTFYVQSANGPTTGLVAASNSGPTNEDPSWDPAPEPSAFVLLGITVLLLAAGIPIADHRLRTSAA